MMGKLRVVVMTVLVAGMVLARAWAIDMHARGGPDVRGREKPDLGRFRRSGVDWQEGGTGGGRALQPLSRGAGVRGTSQQRWLGSFFFVPNPIEEFAVLVDRTKALFGFVRRWAQKAFADVLRQLLPGLQEELLGRLRGWWRSEGRGTDRSDSVAPIRYERTSAGFR